MDAAVTSPTSSFDHAIQLASEPPRSISTSLPQGNAALPFKSTRDFQFSGVTSSLGIDHSISTNFRSTSNSSIKDVHTPGQAIVSAQPPKKGRTATPLISLELCAGSAGISYQLKSRFGLKAIAVDWTRNKGNPQVMLTQLDLSKPHNVAIVSTIRKSAKCGLVAMAPPCGTASRARDRRIHTPGVPDPQPLRDSQHPRGFPWLQGTDAVRVKSANNIYDLCIQQARECILDRTPFFIEGPEGSYMWDIPEFVELAQRAEIQTVIYDACMNGGHRAKRQKLLCFLLDLSAIEKCCDSSHEHLPWSFDHDHGFATAAEAEYPTLFCSRIAEAAARYWNLQEIQPLSAPVEHHNKQVRATTAASAYHQPRGRKIPNLVSEFLSTVKVPSIQCSLDNKRCITASHDLVPLGSKLLSCHGEIPLAPAANITIKEAEFGIYRSPKQWHEAASKTVHPFDEIKSLKPWQAQVLTEIMELGPAGLVKRRAENLRKWTKRKNELAVQEEALHKSMHPQIAQVMKGKSILLFCEMMKDLGFDYAETKELLTKGFPLTGTITPSKLFYETHVEAKLSKAELLSESNWRQMMAVAACGKSDDDFIDRKVYDITLEEEQNGWARGPFTAEQMNARHPGGWVPGRRFGIIQGTKELPDGTTEPKVRQIDDMSAFGMNDTTEVLEKLDLGGIDEIVMMSRAFSQAILGEITSVGDSTGKQWSWVRHKSWESIAPQLKGRPLDLKAAYKQLAVRMSDADVACVAVYNPEKRTVEFWELLVLPFGATASVFDFNRVGRLIEIMMSRLALVLVSGFFDDFTQIDHSLTCVSAATASESILKLLGFKYANEGAKYIPFGSKFKVLGAYVQFAADNTGIEVGNTAERIAALKLEVKARIDNDSCSPSAASSLAGKLNFARTFVSGRCMSRALRILYERAFDDSPSPQLTKRLKQALFDILELLEIQKPRFVPYTTKGETFYVYTDGAVEGDAHTFGAICFTSAGVSLFKGSVDNELKDSWRKLGVQHAIAQTELLPIVLAKLTWSRLLKGKKVIWFTDNEIVRDNLITGSTRCVASTDLLHLNSILDSKLSLINWIARVPSKSNPADAPSRGDISEPVRLFGATEIEHAKLDWKATVAFEMGNVQ